MKHNFIKSVLALALGLISMTTMADNFLPGDWNSWNNTDESVKFVNDEVTVSLDANTTYYFKIYDNGYGNDNLYGNGGVMDYFNHNGWTFGIENGPTGACQITTQAAGNYTFHISWDNTTPSISVDYPELDWSVVPFVASALGANYANTFKIVKQGGVAVDVVQHPGFATADGIYITFPDAAFGEVRANGVNLDHDTQGAGIILHVTNFVDQVTEVNVMNIANDAVRFAFIVYNVNGRFYTEYDHASPDAITEEHETCSPKFTWETDNNGNVVITISAGEGTDGETYFRGAKGMNGTFTLEGGNIADYFTIPTEYTDQYTFTLTLIDPANMPALGTKISYTGQIECRSDIHTNDWSFYQFNGFSYGAKVRVVEDNNAPTAFTATVAQEKAKSVVVTLNATDDNSPRVYYTITDGAAGEWHTAGNSGEAINYTITGLNLSTAYTFSVVVADNAGNVASPIVLNATTTAGVTPVHTYGVIKATATHCWTGTWDGEGEPTFNDFPYTLCYDIVRNADNTISATTFVQVNPASDGRELFNTPGMVYQFVDYKGGTNYHNFVKNGDIYEASTSVDFVDGETAHFMFRMAYNAGGSTPEIWPTVAEASDPYTRTLTVGDFGTLCVPFNATVTGAELYTVAGLIKSGETITGVALDAAATAQAGVPYIIKATASTLTVNYTAVAAFEATTGNFVADPLAVPADNYIVYENELHKVAEGVATIGQNKAYFDLSALDEVAPAPGRLIMPIDGNPVATGIENAAAVKATKALVNGQLVIVRNGAIFNLNGMLVK